MRYLLISVIYICLQVWLSSAAVYVPSGGPVYITPENNNPIISSVEEVVEVTPSSSAAPDMITQTVYGFLDFTTTMGNTVMVFSPHSSAAVVISTTESSKPEEVTKVDIIETKPIESTEEIKQIVEEIKPSKTIVEQKTNEKKNSSNKKSHEVKKVVSSVFEVVSSPVIEEVIEEKKPEPVEVKEEERKIVKQENIIVKEEKIEKPVIKEEVVEKKKPVVSTKVEVREGPSEEKIVKLPKFTTVETVKESVSEEQKSVKIVKPESVKKAPKITTKVEIKTSESTDVSPKTKEEVKLNKEEPKVHVEIIEHKEETKDEKEITESEKENNAESEPAVEVTGILKPLQILSSKVEVIGGEEPATIVGNNIGETPEYYDFLSRQPSEVVDETFRVIDLKPSSPNKVYQKPLRTNIRSSKINQINIEELQPTGLVTSLGGTIVQDGLTTVHETSVLGTFVNGKYAQVLQSTSHIYQNNKKIKPTPSHASKILKTIAPTLGNSDKIKKNVNIIEASSTPSSLEDDNSLPLEALFHSNPSGNLIRQSRRPAVGNGQFKNRYNAINRKQSVEDYVSSEESNDDVDYPSTTSNYRKNKYGNQQQNNNGNQNTGTTSSGRNHKFQQNNRFNKSPVQSTPELATYSVFSEPTSTAAPSLGNGRRFSPSTNSRRKTNKEKEYSYKDENSKSERSRFKNKDTNPKQIIASNVESSTSSSIYKFKLQRPSGRWQYKTTPKPRVAIRRTDELDNTTLNQQPAQLIPDIQVDPDQEISGSGVFPALQHDQDDSVVQDIVPSVTAETIKVAISTPADFKDVYYEIATIRSPYSFQVGTVKNTRFVTVTSTFEKSLVEPTQAINPSEPLTENILATSTANAYDREPPLDSSIVTLPPIGLAGDQETPPLETMTESFSTTQLMLKTHILPVIKAGNTSLYTLVQSYHITRLVSAIKTLPPMEVYQFVPSKTLNEFNTRLDEAGSELHLELDFGDNNDADDERYPNAMKAILSDLDVSHIGSDFNLSDVDKGKIPEQHLRSKKAHNLPSQQNQVSPKILAELPPELQQQLALLKLLNPNAIPNSLLGTSKPVYKLETLYESHVIPLLNGQSTTLSRPIATITKTEYEPVATSAVPQLPQIPQIPQLPLQQPQLPFNQLLPQQPLVQSTPVVQQTMVTETQSKILKLTFGAKTAYTTLFSTTVVPSVVTTFVTQNIQPTAGFPGFYNPAAFGNFPYLG
uniref:DUF4758 domain-containing protein n=1 Tax=Cacopsylla melanoneura TaxID=428564 RepID=A0A8D8QT75_9HEMI